MSTQIKEAISRIRGGLKLVNEDAFITDRYIYSLIMKHSKFLIKRDWNSGSLYRYTSLFKELPCFELIELSTVPECCTGIKTGCVIMRSKDKLPKMVELANGPIIRAVTSLDYSSKAKGTYPSTYANMSKSTNFKFNKQVYYWYLDGYIYLPNVTWEAVRIQAVFEDLTEDCFTKKDLTCVRKQEQELTIPEHLFSELEQMVRQELTGLANLPQEGQDDAKNIMR